MAKPSKKTIEPLLTEWARLTALKARIESKRDDEIASLREKFERQCAPIESTANEKLGPINTKLGGLESDISSRMLAGVGKDGTASLPQVVIDNAIAKVNSTEGARQVDPEKFFRQTPPAKRDSVFWACVRILIAPAEKLKGKLAIDKISSKPTTHAVEIEMKS